ncbi:hypothetical protein [Labrys sp. (in: a-proteobacteria)]|uniref:AbiU2 domain-containing protein n=1 Tax=Labrys sp. (in: a-proteobacteria) TaxID=1917972 RepID=UPI0039E60627
MDTVEATRRVKAITEILALETERAIALRETMEAANRILPPALKDRVFQGAEAYNMMMNALAMDLALTVARLFDFTKDRPLKGQDKASIPVLAALLDLAGVRAEFKAQASKWSAPFVQTASTNVQACETAIDFIQKSVGRVQTQGAPLEAALGRIREFRTKRLAHRLFDKDPNALPKYNDMFNLIDLAMEVVTQARLIVEGHRTEFKLRVDYDRGNAEKLWNAMLFGIEAAIVASEAEA